MSSRPVPKGSESLAMCRGPVENSGHLLLGRIPWCWARPRSRWTAGRAAAGFWHVRGRAECDQELGKRLAHAAWGEHAAGGTLRALPGQMHVLDGAAGETQLGVGQEHEPGPTVRLLGLTHPRRGPVERLLTEAIGVLQVEAVDVRAPEHGQIRRPRPAPPQPQPRGKAGLPRQPLDLDQHEGPTDRGQGAPTALLGMVLALGMHAGPGAHPHGAVLRVLLLVLRSGRPPRALIGAGELRPVSPGAPPPPVGAGRWVRIEAAPAA